MHLDGVLRDDALADDELLDLLSLVALQLDHLAVLFTFDDGAVAAELLAQGLEDLLDVLLGDTLDGRHGLLTVSLLDAKMHVAFFAAFPFRLELSFGVKSPAQVEYICHKNWSRGTRSFSLFEVGDVFGAEEDLARESSVNRAIESRRRCGRAVCVDGLKIRKKQ